MIPHRLAQSQSAPAAGQSRDHDGGPGRMRPGPPWTEPVRRGPTRRSTRAGGHGVVGTSMSPSMICWR